MFIESIVIVSVLGFMILLIVTTIGGCSSQQPPFAPPSDDFNFTIPQEEDFNITQPFVVTEEMMTDTINRDTFLLIKINDLEQELVNRTNLLSNVMLLFRNMLNEVESCDCKCSKECNNK